MGIKGEKMTLKEKEIEKAIKLRDKIVKKQDIDALFELTDIDDFDIGLFEILSNQCNYNPLHLKGAKRTLLLCMFLENYGQSDSILNFINDEFTDFNDEIVNALNEIEAFKSAEIIKQAIELLPKGGTWFFDVADEETKKLMSKFDSRFSDYPDGKMSILYRKYAEAHKEELKEK